jgi:hypothetical protein
MSNRGTGSSSGEHGISSGAAVAEIPSSRIRLSSNPVLFWGPALLLGMIEIWPNRFYMGNDGVSYLDMADAYLRGDWHMALNSSWNPLYALLVASDFLILHPSPQWEDAAVQFLNFFIYALAVFGFEFFLRQLLASRQLRDELGIRLIAYALFLWSSLILIGTWTTNADMLVSAFVYFGLAFLLRLRMQDSHSLRDSILLGVVLAAGYWSKAFFFPVSLVVLAVLAATAHWRRALVSALVFGAFSLPVIGANSLAARHPSIGETGKVNYAWYVDEVATRWWQGGPARAGRPLHPPRIVLDSPRIYQFDGVFPNATYPIWYDFAYWYQGLHVWFGFHKQAAALRTNLQWFLSLLVRDGALFSLGWAICFSLYRKRTHLLRNFATLWPASIPAAVAVLLYLVVHIESRYIGSFIVVLMLIAFSSFEMKKTWLAASIGTAGLAWAVIFAPVPTEGAHFFPWQSPTTNLAWQAAASLEDLGLRPDANVASACYSNRQNVFWARLARVHIVAETDWNVFFWQLNEADQQRVLAALRSSGATFAVLDTPPPDPARAADWRQLGNTNFYAYRLAQVAQPALKEVAAK